MEKKASVSVGSGSLRTEYVRSWYGFGCPLPPPPLCLPPPLPPCRGAS
jgi:hypothetical protein